MAVTETLWTGSIGDKLYLTSGKFTSTLRPDVWGVPLAVWRNPLFVGVFQRAVRWDGRRPIFVAGDVLGSDCGGYHCAFLDAKGSRTRVRS